MAVPHIPNRVERSAYRAGDTWAVGVVCWGVVAGASEPPPKRVFQAAIASTARVTTTQVAGFFMRRETVVGLT